MVFFQYFPPMVSGYFCTQPHFMIHLRPNGCSRDSADIECSNGQDIAQIYRKHQKYTFYTELAVCGDN